MPNEKELMKAMLDKRDQEPGEKIKQPLTISVNLAKDGNLALVFNRPVKIVGLSVVSARSLAGKLRWMANLLEKGYAKNEEPVHQETKTSSGRHRHKSGKASQEEERPTGEGERTETKEGESAAAFGPAENGA